MIGSLRRSLLPLLLADAVDHPGVRLVGGDDLDRLGRLHRADFAEHLRGRKLLAAVSQQVVELDAEELLVLDEVGLDQRQSASVTGWKCPPLSCSITVLCSGSRM